VKHWFRNCTSVCRHCLEHIVTDCNILVVKNSSRFKKIMKFEKRKNQDGMRRSYMLNDRKYKIFQKRNLVKVGMWKCSGTLSRNVC